MTVKLTKKRLQILNLLKISDKAMSAKEIHQSLDDIDLVTIYRNLDLFVKEKIISKVHLNDDKVLYEYQEEPHYHAVCNDCERIIHFKAPDEKIKEVLNLNDFSIEEISVTVRGVCKSEYK